MRVLSPTGKLQEVIRVVPFVEKQDAFNGRVIYNSEVARDLGVNPTGLRLYLQKEQNDFFIPTIYIGNLSTEKVQEILSTILKEEYYDFSQMQYQKVSVPFCSDVTIDGGKSLPFFEEQGCDLFPAPFGNTIMNDIRDLNEKDNAEEVVVDNYEE